MLHVYVDNRIRFSVRDVDAEMLTKLKSEFEHKNPEIGLKRRLGIPTYGVPETIRTWRQSGKEISFPRGGMGRVRRALHGSGTAFEVHDRRTDGGPNPNPPSYCGDPPRWYQTEGKDAALVKQQCILRAPTGSGKTTMAFMLVGELKMCTLVMVSTKALFKQWMKRATRELGIAPEDVGVIQGKTRKLRPFTIGIQKSVAIMLADPNRGPEMKDYFGAVICDEVQLFAAKTFFESVDPFPAKVRIGISADEKRKDRKEFLTYDLFGDVAHEIKRKTLEEQGHVLDVEIRVVPTTFRADWYGVPDEGDENDEKEVDFNRLLDEITTHRTRNEMIAAIGLDEAALGEQVIILTHRRDHCRVLDQAFVADRVKSGYLIGGDDYEKEFDSTRAGIESGEIRVGIGTYLALGYGVDLPAVGIGIAATPIAANKQQFNQVRGRLCRTSAATGKKGARLYYLWDANVYPRHLDNIMAWNQSVVVRSNGKWIPAREYKNAKRAQRKAS